MSVKLIVDRCDQRTATTTTTTTSLSTANRAPVRSTDERGNGETLKWKDLDDDYEVGVESGLGFKDERSF